MSFGGTMLFVGVALSVAAPLAAETVTGTTVDGRVYHRPDSFGDGPPVALSFRATAVNYDTIAFTVGTSGGYSLVNTASYDTYLGLYRDSFDAAAPLNNALIYNDDIGFDLSRAGFDYDLVAGASYIAVATSFANGVVGPYSLAIDGPGAVTVAEPLVVEGSTAGGPIFHRPEAFGDDPPVGLAGFGTSFAYQSVAFTASNDGLYDLLVTANYDTYLGLYEYDFDPAAPLANALIYNDDVGFDLTRAGFGYQLVGGRDYIAVVTSWKNGITGNFRLSIDGPGFVTLASGVGAVPEPASWALMIAGFGLVGGALRGQRRTAVAAQG